MSPEGWALNLGAIASALVAAYNSYFAKEDSRKAKELSEPTGNGFSKLVLAKLMAIEDKLDTHIHDHITGEFDNRDKDDK